MSDFHFNASIVGNELFVIQGFNPIDYANRIMDIINSYNLDSLSEFLLRRVRRNYSYSVVNSRICKELRCL